jgi:hypothetical protein
MELAVLGLNPCTVNCISISFPFKLYLCNKNVIKFHNHNRYELAKFDKYVKSNETVKVLNIYIISTNICLGNFGQTLNLVD